MGPIGCLACLIELNALSEPQRAAAMKRFNLTDELLASIWQAKMNDRKAIDF